ncbi:ankyrin repeat and SOCS box protein 5b isoform X2 [Kryptolebias marmoratus]|uniref:ankyrin repeat and SOCS box protein 5b isoform X2 n=1 Tax=Kryptolebias marmoratus TaxID=37003 RepID=UPI0007F8CDC8|nr:ankyrin repeat and SOCS box protein 5b isoform X2 [Kryptolebias marmoratus]
MSRKRAAEPVLFPTPDQERKRVCWGILTSQGSWADRSPLHEAASQGRLLALRTLLTQGNHANIVTIDHVTPLHEACLSGHVACVRALISVGANVNAATIDGATPLFNCCASGSVGCLELLLQNGAHVYAHHTHFPSALHEASKRGACVNVGRGEDSPLHAAVRQGSADQVSLLLNYGADINLRDGNNQRPVDLAHPGERIQRLLVAFEVSPRSLCQLCRLQIRKVVGQNRLKLLPLLPLPSILTHYLEQIQYENDWPTCSTILK